MGSALESLIYHTRRTLAVGGVFCDDLNLSKNTMYCENVGTMYIPLALAPNTSILRFMVALDGFRGICVGSNGNGYIGPPHKK